MYFPNDKRLDAILNAALLAVLLVAAVFFSPGCSALSGSGETDPVRIDLNDPAVLRTIADAHGWNVGPFASEAQRAAAQESCETLGTTFATAYGMDANGFVCAVRSRTGPAGLEEIAAMHVNICKRVYSRNFRLYDHRTNRLECW